MKPKDFNKQVLDAVNPDADPFLANYIIAAYGKRLAGTQVDSDATTCHCGSTKQVAKRRLNTAYADDERNWYTSCVDCYIEAYEQFKEQWEDFYASRF